MEREKGFEPSTACLEGRGTNVKCLTNMSTTELAKLSGLSKQYISVVKHGKRPPSQKLLNAISNHLETRKPRPQKDYLSLFLKSRQSMGVSPKTLEFYKDRLSQFTRKVNYIKATRQQIERYLNSIPANRYGLATRHASFRAIKTFYRWLETEYGLKNPINGMSAPILGKPIMPSLTQDQVEMLLAQVHSIRDKAIISLLTESGLRISELAQIKPEDIDWENRIIRVLGKGRKEAYATFGDSSERYLREWLSNRNTNGNIWSIGKSGITTMLRRLEEQTGLPCNAHTFRRTFACLLRKAGVDTMTIKDLGRWESLEMVQRYTRSVTFHDSLKHYKAPLS